ncbi:MAG: 5-oxoprolinase subunit PxpB [Porticoccaceae bacterium]|nr:5-oxoprolinase subunit PxpB [Porticoccaceae bacterium]
MSSPSDPPSGFPQICIAGENSLIVYFGDAPSATISAEIAEVASDLKAQLGTLLIDSVPSYASLLLIYDHLQTDHFYIRAQIHAVLSRSQRGLTQPCGRLLTLPVYYSAESGPDLETLAERAKLSAEQVIWLHQKTEYRVYAIGFAPGFAYLGQVDERIAAPRKTTPRLRVPAGAVAIANRQTAVYPYASPGGWNLIGRCPTTMFDPQKTPSMPVQVGDRVRFNAIDRDRYLALGGQL